MRVSLTKGISKTALTNAVTACEASEAVITGMTTATGAAGTEVIWDGTLGILTVPKGDIGATGATGDTGATGEAGAHDDMTGKDADAQHPTSSIYQTGNTGINLDTILLDKADKVVGGTVDNIASIDAGGNFVDSGIANTDIVQPDSYATDTVGGTIKIAVIGTDCYITTDGTTPGV